MRFISLTKLSYFWILIAFISLHEVAKGTALEVDTDSVEINNANIDEFEICIKKEGDLKNNMDITIRVPSKVGNRKFQSFLILVNGERYHCDGN